MIKPNGNEPLQDRVIARPETIQVGRPQFVLARQADPPFKVHPPSTAAPPASPVPTPPPASVTIPHGPIVTADNPPVFNDRLDANTKWYLPDFTLKTPLVDSFTFNCERSAPDKEGNPTYIGEATFVVHKSMPAAVADLTKAPGATYNEIPLHTFTIAFVVNLANSPPLSYPGQLIQDGDDYCVSISLSSQDSLIRFYKFISDPANAKYCRLSVNASYLGYTLRPKDPQFNNFRAAFLANHIQTMQMRNATLAPQMRTTMMPRPPIGIGEPGVGGPVPPHPVPHNPADDYDMQGAIPFTKTIACNYDCHTFTSNYLVKQGDSGAKTAFGCKPPFGDASTQRYTYEKVNLTNGDLSEKDYGIKAIYQNTYNNAFLVIPSRYVIALDHSADEQLLTPAARLFTLIDLKEINNSTAEFLFSIAPEISHRQLLTIKKLILNNLPASLNKSVGDIFVEFPDRIHQGDKVVFDSARIPEVLVNSLDSYRSGVLGSKYFDLELQNVAIGKGDAEWVAKQAKLEGIFPPPLAATITFEVDSDVERTQEATVGISLNRIVGDGIVFDQVSKQLKNRTFYDITLGSYQPSGAAEPVQLTPPVEVPANSSVSAETAGLPTDISVDAFEYAYHANSDYIDQILKEIRIVNVDTITDDIIVTNNTGLFSLYKIKTITFQIWIMEPGETDPNKALATRCIDLIKDGVINHVPFALPVAEYLSTRYAVYATTVNFEDRAPQVNPPQRIEDLNKIGKFINLTVSALNLSKQ